MMLMFSFVLILDEFLLFASGYTNWKYEYYYVVKDGVVTLFGHAMNIFDAVIVSISCGLYMMLREGGVRG
jgi:hypothetical protein